VPSEGLEAEHETSDPFHGAMVLLHEVIEIFRVADDNRDLVHPLIGCNRRRVAATLIDRDFLRQSLTANSFA